MKRFVTLCMACIMIHASVQVISAAGLTDAGAGLSGSEGSVVSQEIASSEGAPFDAGSTSRSGDIQNRSGMADESSAEIPSETGENATESADSAGNPDSVSPNPTDNAQTDGGTGSSGGNWFSIILAIVIVAAIAALIVALLPRRNRM